MICAPLRLPCRWSFLWLGRADALPIPDRANTRPVTVVGEGVRVLPGGVQRCAPSSRRGLPSRREVVRQRRSAPGNHSGQIDCRAKLAQRGTQCCASAVGQRLPPRMAKLLRLQIGQTQRAQDWSASDEVAEGSSTVVSPYAQWIPLPSEWAAQHRQAGRGTSPMVQAFTDNAIVSDGRPRTRWPLLRQLCCRRADVAATKAGTRSGRRRRSLTISDHREQRFGAFGCAEPEKLATQATETAAIGAGEGPPPERITKQRQDAAEDCHHTRRGGSYQTRLPPQTGIGVDSREPSGLRRGPQYRRDARQSPVSACDFRRGVGAVLAHSERKRPNNTAAPCIRCRVGWRPARPVRRASISWENWVYKFAPGHVHHAARSTTAITTLPRSFSPPGGRRD
ncbi:MAG: hypothetical protein JWQ31_4395 [Mycobacterium sp.]|nr:hypothetical protein [Mycobacterium sp.]